MSNLKLSGLSRPIQPMPDFVKDALEKSSLFDAYKSRPPYQQNDYFLLHIVDGNEIDLILISSFPIGTDPIIPVGIRE